MGYGSVILLMCSVLVVPLAGAQSSSPARPGSPPAVPRRPDGTPDISGVWQRPYVPDMTRTFQSQQGPAELPYTPAGALRFKNFDVSKFDYTGHCLPFGLMRSINSMIEFKQSIGRGTRLYDGKDYFTIYDFVKAHHHFNDPEWDGEPLEPEPKAEPKAPGPPREPKPGPEPGPRQQKIKVKLADGKARAIQHMIVTSFWHPDGTPMSAQQFMEMLFGRLPDFFKDEAELRALWSAPDTRARLRDQGVWC